MASGHDTHPVDELEGDGHGHDDHGHDDHGHGHDDHHGSGGDAWVLIPIAIGLIIGLAIALFLGLGSGVPEFG